MRLLALTLLSGLAIVLPCRAGFFSHCCSECGCSHVKKVCRVVPDVKKVPDIRWVVECEDICLPGRTRCVERMVNDNCVVGDQHCETVAEPTCDRIITRKKLKKVTTTIDKPGFKCIVETVCSQCGTTCGK